VLIASGFGSGSVYAGELDGKSFAGPTGMIGKKTSGKDERRFEKGRAGRGPAFFIYADSNLICQHY